MPDDSEERYHDMDDDSTGLDLEEVEIVGQDVDDGVIFDMRGMTALVVDDAISILKMISFILSKEGVTVSQAKDGKEAVDKMQQFIFDFVIMDIQVRYDMTLALPSSLCDISSDYPRNLPSPPVSLTTHHPLSNSPSIEQTLVLPPPDPLNNHRCRSWMGLKQYVKYVGWNVYLAVLLKPSSVSVHNTMVIRSLMR